MPTVLPEKDPPRASEGRARRQPADRLVATSELCEGVRVEVRNRFLGTWSQGFEFVAQVDGRIRIRRLSDGCELPDHFDRFDVRPESARRWA